MKSFMEICKMTQPQVKAYMKEYLTSLTYNVVDEDGFLYAKGETPVLLVAHMDTVHKQQCKTVYETDDKIYSPEGIGGDDRCGIFIIMNIVREIKCSVLLCEDEEKGGIGAHKFIKATYKGVDEKNEPIDIDYIDTLDVNYMIEFDRRGNSDAVFYSCDNKNFTDFVIDATGFTKETGTYSDISTLMPAAHIAGVNLSSGYYKAHSTDEYVVYEEMMDTVEVAKELILTECEEPFEYIAKVYNYTKTNWNVSHYRFDKDDERLQYYEDLLDGPKYADERLYHMAKNEDRIEMEAIVTDAFDGREDVKYADGKTKDECWKNLFLDNPDLCFNQVVDWSWN